MKIKWAFIPAISFCFVHCGICRQIATNVPAIPETQKASGLPAGKTDTLSLFDTSRNRAVPVALYSESNAGKRTQKLVIINHGYGAKNTAYSYIANNLAAYGYLVASIQHEMPGDEPMPATGNIFETRKPYWQRGVENILFVIRELKKRRPDADYKNLVLIGHSNGGDMAMLFAHEYPGMVNLVISLDNRRMPFPRTKQPRIFSLRSSDQVADPGVLPTPQEQEQYNIRVVQLKNTIHNDMDDNGTNVQKQEINSYILQFLESNK